jgi:hypothetical protein
VKLSGAPARNENFIRSNHRDRNEDSAPEQHPDVMLRGHFRGRDEVRIESASSPIFFSRIALEPISA